MKKDAKIFIAGHNGLVGSAILRALKKEGYQRLITCSRKELDLCSQPHVEAFFKKHKPEYVFLCAAKVGGIHANSTYPATFIYDNLAIQNHVIHLSKVYGVQRLLFLGSSCIYPKECPQPMQEKHLLSQALEPTNRPYALAKIAGVEMCWAYNRQYSTEFIAPMPTNLYGIGDNFHPENSHVLPALIAKFHEAKSKGNPSITLWGSGRAKREFLFSEDLAQACLMLMEKPKKDIDFLFSKDHPPIINIGFGQDLTVYNLAYKIASLVGFRGDILWDRTKADGPQRKFLDSTQILSLGWKPCTSLEEGLTISYQHYLDTHQQVLN